MRAAYLSLIAIVSLTVATASSGGEDKGDEVLKKIQGAWKFVSQEMSGKARPEDELKGLKVTFTGDKWAVTMDGKLVQGGTHKFDTSKKPVHVDALVREGEGKGEKMLGIFEMKGDKLYVCFDPSGKERPTSFKSAEGQFSAVVQREKKKAE